MIEKEAGTPGKNSFDQIMNNPTFSRDGKEEAIRSIFKNGSNAAGWQYFTDAIGGKR
jgi:F0F1-type ATP synthase delta subunit